jgi:hypothetical protein
MKNRLLINTLLVVLPYTAFANTLEDIKELRSKIKETSEEFRIVCKGYNSNAYRVGSDSSEYCNYLEREVDLYIEKVMTIINEDTKWTLLKQ